MSSVSDARAIAVVLAAATGCNAAFDLAQTSGTREFFDAAPDAPYRCPGLGETPRFQRDLVQVLTQNCSTYSISERAGLALASCTEPERGIYVGSPGGALTRAAGFEPGIGTWVDSARIAADGDLALAKQCSVEGPCTLAVFRRRSDGTWVDGGTTGIAIGVTESFSAPSLAPDRRFLLARGVGVDEYAEEPGGAWRLALTHVLPSSTQHASLGADGLRMISSGRASAAEPMAAMYLDRSAVDEPFTQPRTIAVPHERDHAITEDCGHVYFTALRSVFYVARE